MASIQIQMNEFQNVSTMLASKMDLFETSLHEVLAEFNNGR